METPTQCTESCPVCFVTLNYVPPRRLTVTSVWSCKILQNDQQGTRGRTGLSFCSTVYYLLTAAVWMELGLFSQSCQQCEAIQFLWSDVRGKELPSSQRESKLLALQNVIVERLPLLSQWWEVCGDSLHGPSNSTQISGTNQQEHLYKITERRKNSNLTNSPKILPN